MEQKKILLSIMVVGMISSAALAVAPIGPPVAGLAEGQYGVGIGYAIADLEVEFEGMNATTGRRGVQNAEASMYYVNLGYGISDEWCAHVILGMSEIEADADGLPATGDDFDGDSKFTYGISTKRTLHDNGTDTKWGVAFQYLRGSSKDTLSTASSFGNGTFTTSVPDTISVDWYMMQLAMGPAIQLSDDLCLYGGPFLMLIEADVRSSILSAEAEVEQALELGGFIGAMLNLGGNAGLGLEFLLSDQSWGAGISAMFPL